MVLRLALYSTRSVAFCNAVADDGTIDPQSPTTAMHDATLRAEYGTSVTVTTMRGYRVHRYTLQSSRREATERCSAAIDTHLQ
ncbi:hypothetical protein Y032_0540g3167 [Ancylostoma ceylanicum]|uniref:Uncharacterized protein n=1 Tax=Ancylostoma ceylanicum TaxID=53326 RepID=A0A016WT52_9BILA|nr:hypothetical protein Y032_0540g3167 [Ancylostoma ceylanicum]